MPALTRSRRRAVAATVIASATAAAGLFGTTGAGAITGSRDVKILGGSIAAPGQFPWMVALVDPRSANASNGEFCGGSLIAPKVVLTAAHCVAGTTASEIDAVVGRTRLSRSADGQRISVTRIVRHPDYDAKTQTDDVALLQLAEPAAVTPLALDGPGDAPAEKPSTLVTVAGWGATKEGGNTSDDLRFVPLRIRSNAACENEFGDVDGEATVCAGSTRAGEDSCQGDSGGPLFRGDGDTARQVGIVSYGAGCGRAGVPGVYTRVGGYAEFIAQQAALLNGDAIPPAADTSAPVVRVEDVTCGVAICTTTLSVAGRAPAGGIALNITRARYRQRKKVDRFVFAKRFTATRWVVKADLPYGLLTLYAIPLNKAQDDLDGDGDVAEISISHQ